jgi:hypothetical protein
MRAHSRAIEHEEDANMRHSTVNAFDGRKSDIPSYLRRPGLQPRRLRVIGIGAGASGLLLAYKLQRNFENVDLTIFEKNSGLCLLSSSYRSY